MADRSDAGIAPCLSRVLCASNWDTLEQRWSQLDFAQVCNKG